LEVNCKRDSEHLTKQYLQNKIITENYGGMLHNFKKVFESKIADIDRKLEKTKLLKDDIVKEKKVA